MTIAEQKQALEKLQQQFDIAHAEIKSKLKTAQAEKNFTQVIALLNEERAMVKENSEKMLALIAEARS
jgi:uncharacterized protein YlxP (DUF503 family)